MAIQALAHLDTIPPEIYILIQGKTIIHGEHMHVVDGSIDKGGDSYRLSRLICSAMMSDAETAVTLLDAVVDFLVQNPPEAESFMEVVRREINTRG